jgi:uridylate kinase
MPHISFSQSESFVFSVGGSLIAPTSGLNTLFLSKLNTFVRRNVAGGKRFYLIAGGGALARSYRDAGKVVIGTLTNEDLDWLGIHATRLNAHLLRTIFQDIAHPRILESYEHKLVNVHESVIIGAGWKPGWSTDYCAVTMAKDYGAKVIVNLSNIDVVCDSDPRTNPQAKKIEDITWKDFQKLVGDVWKPGLNAPFDPIASKLSLENDMTVIVINGTNFKNIEAMMAGEEFVGTVIHP